MREILFKGKRVDNGEWVEGSCVVTEKEAYIVFGVETMPIDSECCDLYATEWYQVNPETVCQFIGLTDKNGVKIFEGDIVSTDIERPYLIVEFRDGCFMFNCNDGGEDYYDIMLPILDEPQTQYKYGEVIGNIFDNSELMEGGGSDEID